MTPPSASPPPIRLSYFVDSMEVGGSELNAIRTLERLDRARFDLTVFHMGHQGPLLERYAALGLPLVRVSLRNFKHPSALSAGLRLVGELRRRRVEIVHSQDIYSNIFAVPWARAARTPVVIASKRWHQVIPSRTHVLANRIASRLATRVLANSQAVARSLVVEDGVSPSRIEVLPNYVGPEAFEDYPPGERRRLLASFGIPDGALVAGVVARLRPEKDHAMFIRAALPLLQTCPDLHLLLIGDGPMRATLEAQVSQAGAAGRVHFAGTLPNLPNLHRLLDISVLPSKTEGFPNSVVEAMAAGRPVIATQVGGTPEAVLEGRTGLLVPPGVETSMARALQQLIDSPEERRTLGDAGRERARSEYYADAVLERLSAWYVDLHSRS